MALTALWVSVAVLCGGTPPAVRTPLTDLAQVLAAEEVEEISEALIELRETRGVQMAVLIVPGLEGEDIESFSIRVAEGWGGGSAGADKGLLLVLTIAEQRVRLEVGYGLEANLPDVIARRVIDRARPVFAAGRMGDGISLIIGSVDAVLAGKELPSPDPERLPDSYWVVMVVAAVAGVWMTLAELLARRGRTPHWTIAAPLGIGGVVLLFWWPPLKVFLLLYLAAALFWFASTETFLGRQPVRGVMAVLGTGALWFAVPRGLEPFVATPPGVVAFVMAAMFWMTALAAIKNRLGGADGASRDGRTSFSSRRSASSSSSSNSTSWSGGGGRFGGGGASGSW